MRGYVIILDFRSLRYANFSQYHQDGSLLSRPPISRSAYSRWLQFLAASFPSLKFIIADGLTESNLNAILPVEVETDAHSIASSQKFKAAEQLDLELSRCGIDESNRASNSLGMTPKKPESVQMSPQPVMLSLAGCAQFDTSILRDHSNTRNLLYLDVSWTRIGSSSLSPLANLPHLKILKLSGLRLKTQQLS